DFIVSNYIRVDARQIPQLAFYQCEKFVALSSCCFSMKPNRVKKPNCLIVDGKIHPMNTVEDIQRRIIELEIEHRDLDHAIEALNLDIRHDELQLRRLKKRKLQLKDHITLLKMQLVPDVPA
ncbi:MAG: hypothetical protein K0S28_1664, partial [Paucimonas sp.]|nr:hypothetical protein [Paucimonas sp.]